MQDPCIDDRRRLQSLHGRHAIFDERLELARILTVRKRADVAAITDRHTGGESRPEAPMLERDIRRHGIDALSPAIAHEACFGGGEGRTNRDAVLPQQGHELGRERIAMLDRGDAGTHGALDA